MNRFRTILLAVLVVAGVAVYLAFDAEMRRARAAIAGRSTVVETAAGAIEYADSGSGYPLLTIHGAGGGFDQGLDNARAMFEDGFRRAYSASSVPSAACGRRLCMVGS